MDSKSTPNKRSSQVDSLALEKHTTSNAIQIPEITLPNGGGALKGIDEKFEINTSNGTASFTIPLPISPGRNGFSPSLSLSYNSGGGNSPFGLGWNLDLPGIQRKTDIKIPQYIDNSEEDVFLFSGMEDLVSYLEETVEEKWVEKKYSGNGLNGITIKRYRPRIEGGFVRIEKIQHNELGIYWRMTTRENIVTIFGRNKEARIADPKKPNHIFKWLPELTYDDKGNWIQYHYKKDTNIDETGNLINDESIPHSLSEKNRKSGLANFTNTYLKRITYGNRLAWYVDPSQVYNPQIPENAEFFFEMVFDYGEHDAIQPLPNDRGLWNYREDAFSTYRSGFEIRTNRLCQRILMFHHFPNENQFIGTVDEDTFGNNYLVKSLNLSHEPSSINNSGQTEVSYLKSATQFGFIKKPDGTYSSKSLPPLVFNYQTLLWNHEIKTVSPKNIINAPVGLSNNYQWVDLYGEGLSGILTEQGGSWYYKSNLGNHKEEGKLSFTPARQILSKPSFNGLSTTVLSIQDLESNGEKQVVIQNQELKGFFELNTEKNWANFQAFEKSVNINYRDPNTRFFDLNGNGQPDLVISEENAFVWFPANGKKGYDSFKSYPKQLEEELGPTIVFADQEQSIFLADMSGDGLTDIVRIRNGEICYWANMGYGKFSPKITMDNAPIFDFEDLYHPKYLHLADISGTGATDIIYLGTSQFKAFINLSGNAWSDQHKINSSLPVNSNTKLSVVDLLGTGTSCIVWSSDLPNDVNKPMRYIDLMNSNHTPYTIYYRTWNEYEKWSPWEKVDAAIPVVNVSGNPEEGTESKSGIHLIPVVWKNRLLLFWPEFIEKSEPVDNSNRTFEAIAGDNIGVQQPKKYWEVRLAWSEYYDGGWTAKEVSEEFFMVEEIFNQIDSKNLNLSELSFTSFINNDGFLEIFLVPFNTDNINSDNADGKFKGNGKNFSPSYPTFLIKSITDKISMTQEPRAEIVTSTGPAYTFPWLADIKLYRNTSFVRRGSKHSYSFMQAMLSNENAEIPLKFYGNTYLKNEIAYKLLFPNQLQFIEFPTKYPFFYFAQNKTYFVRLNNWNVRRASHSRLENSDGNTPGFGGSIPYLNFNTFHHPFTDEFIQNLNKHGIGTDNSGTPGLLDTDTLTKSSTGKKYDEFRTFKDLFDPEWNNIFRPIDQYLADPNKTYFKETIDFDPLGANSQYNWELFFHAPLYIATQLSKNGKYADAMKWFHYIFDPTTDEVVEGVDNATRFWKVKPFKTTSASSFEDYIKNLLPREEGEEDAAVKEWRDNPFDPHLVASNFPVNYQKHVLLAYIENLVNWGDSLFRKFSRENVYEAIQLYVIASHILGPKPPYIPKRGEIKNETFASLSGSFNDLSNARVELENNLLFSSGHSGATGRASSSLLGTGSVAFFCIPTNEKLFHYWEIVEDRLFKIRNCKDINGVARRLALFAPPIDPAALIRARSAGMELSEIVDDLDTPAPHQRFGYLLQKANEYCNDVKNLGGSLLSVLEKRDSEELNRLRSNHENELLQMIQEVRERQILEAKSAKNLLVKQRETAAFRLKYYNEDLLGNDSITIPVVIPLLPELDGDSQIVVNPQMDELAPDVDVALVDGNEDGLKIIPREEEDLVKRKTAAILSNLAGGAEMAGSIAALFPNVHTKGQPLGMGVAAAFGGENLAFNLQMTAKVLHTTASTLNQYAGLASTTASYIRREQDWTLQANLAAKEIQLLERQIISADIRIQIAEKELKNHKKQLENAHSIEIYLKGKFSNQELYTWMKDQLVNLYKQTYDLAFEMALKAQKAFGFEKGNTERNFIEYGFWDGSKKGLLAGEQLQLGLRQLDRAYQDANQRQFELTKHISLQLLNPTELIKLKATGQCSFDLFEELFDLDYPGHFNRRIKSVSLSIPCITGPYTTIACTLRLTKNTTRVKALVDGGVYNNRDSESIFHSQNIPIGVIATSSGQNDSGVYELNFRDERYLPFEGAGAISGWSLELFNDDHPEHDNGKSLRQFDYDTISDVIVHVRYTAQEDLLALKRPALDNLYSIFEGEQKDRSAIKYFNIKQDFPNDWYRFLHPDNPDDGQVLNISLLKDHFPYWDQQQSLEIKKVHFLAKCKGDHQKYKLTLKAPSEATSKNIDLVEDTENFGGIHSGEKAIPITLDWSTKNDWTISLKSPTGDLLKENELEELFVILDYSWK